jgi:hypothetical protein
MEYFPLRKARKDGLRFRDPGGLLEILTTIPFTFEGKGNGRKEQSEFLGQALKAKLLNYLG